MVKKGGHLSAAHKAAISRGLRRRKHIKGSLRSKVAKAKGSNTHTRQNALERRGTEAQRQAASIRADVRRGGLSAGAKQRRLDSAKHFEKQATTHFAVARALQLKRDRAARKGR
jgi:hypothetical protein